MAQLFIVTDIYLIFKLAPRLSPDCCPTNYTFLIFKANATNERPSNGLKLFFQAWTARKMSYAHLNISKDYFSP